MRDGERAVHVRAAHQLVEGGADAALYLILGLAAVRQKLVEKRTRGLAFDVLLAVEAAEVHLHQAVARLEALGRALRQRALERLDYAAERGAQNRVELDPRLADVLAGLGGLAAPELGQRGVRVPLPAVGHVELGRAVSHEAQILGHESPF